MQITSKTFVKATNGYFNSFYRATQSSVDRCQLLLDGTGNLAGLGVGQQFIDLSTQGAIILAFDGRGATNFTSQAEATAAHRDAVIAYLDQLNSSSLRSFPILYGNPTNL